MAIDQWHRVQDLFEQALTVPPDRRAGFLTDACPDDPAARAEVLSLLESDEAVPAGFMQQPPRPGHIPEIGQPTDPLIGKLLGQYKIERMIGSGGMGTVYEATQQQPKRSVALKVLHAWSARGSVLRRFEFESQVLAHLSSGISMTSRSRPHRAACSINSRSLPSGTKPWSRPVR